MRQQNANATNRHDERATARTADANDRLLTPALIEACRLLRAEFSSQKSARDAEEYDDRILSHDANAMMHFYSAATDPNDDVTFLPHDADSAHYRNGDETLDENITTERHRVDRRLPTQSTLNANDGFLTHDDVINRPSPCLLYTSDAADE